MSPQLSIVIAVQGGSSRLEQVLDALDVQCPPEVEVLVCFAAEESEVPRICQGRRVRLVAGARSALIPELWRDGISAATGERVALSIGHCRPASDWVKKLRDADLATFAAVGGALENEPESDALGWAVYILRYARFAPPFARVETPDLPGDNALYDRTALLPHAAAFADGFWEPEIHALLLKDGRRLLLDPTLLSIHANGYRALAFAKQRLRHGARFGLDRARSMSLPRALAQIALYPLVPAVFGAKVLSQAWKRPSLRAHLPAALPHLALFVNAWSLGELGGTARALVERVRSG
ncbi:MAG TPA: hypothetical protein VGJ91_08070 [Polyangiaceae bacterium]|jgi:hypothetical protein